MRNALEKTYEKVRENLFLTIELEKGFHDKFDRLAVDVEIFSSVGENGLPHHRPVYCGNFECRKIIDIPAPGDEFVRHGPQGGFGIATGAYYIGIFPKRGPKVDRRDRDNDFASRIMFGH